MGVEVEVPEQLAGRLERDFARFLGAGPAQARLRLQLGPLPELPGGLRERFRGPHFVCFGEAARRFIRYGSRAWLSWDGQQLDLYAHEPDHAYLRLMLCIQSRLGALLEDRGLYRVHGLGLENGLVLLPPGGGKSTLAAELLRRGQGARLLSEDTPVLDGRGQLHSFPFRLGLRDDPGLECERQGHKWLLPFPAEGRISSPCRQLVLGAWTTAERPVLERLGRLSGLPALLRDAVVGYGVPQLIELYWPLSVAEQLQRAALAASRLAAVVSLLGRCQVSRLWMCRHTGANLDCLDELLARP